MEGLRGLRGGPSLAWVLFHSFVIWGLVSAPPFLMGILFPQGLRCVEHRGGVLADGATGDGSGIMTEIPWALIGEKPDSAALATVEGVYAESTERCQASLFLWLAAVQFGWLAEGPRLPRDVVRIIARAVWASRCDPVLWGVRLTLK